MSWVVGTWDNKSFMSWVLGIWDNRVLWAGQQKTQGNRVLWVVQQESRGIEIYGLCSKSPGEQKFMGWVVEDTGNRDLTMGWVVAVVQTYWKRELRNSPPGIWHFCAQSQEESPYT